MYIRKIPKMCIDNSGDKIKYNDIFKKNIVNKKWFIYTYVLRIIYNYNYNLSKLKKISKKIFFYKLQNICETDLWNECHVIFS